jgi:hypothetical protein
MANTVAIDVKINALEAATTLKDLKKNLKDAVNELAGLEQGTEDFNRLAGAVDDANDRIEALKKGIEQVGSAGKFEALTDMGSKIAAGFEVAQGAMALFGSESEEVEKALQKVQAAMAISQGLKELSEVGKTLTQVKTIATDLGGKGVTAIKSLWTAISSGQIITKAVTAAQYAWNAALNANPIFLVVTALAALAAGVAFLMASEEDENEVLEEGINKRTALIELLKEENETANIVAQNKINLMKAQGAADKELFDLEQNLRRQRLEQEKKNAILLNQNLQDQKRIAVNTIRDGDEDEIKSATDKFNELRKAQRESTDNILKLEGELEAAAAQRDTNDKKKADENRKKAAENNKKYADLQKELNDRLAQLRIENMDDERKQAIEKENLDFKNTKKEYETKYAGRKELNDLLYELENKHLNAISEINNKYNKIENDKKDAENKKKLDLIIEGINNEKIAIENQRKLTYEEQIVFENRIYEATISNTKLTLAEKEKLELEHQAKLKGLNDGFQAEIQAKQNKFNADEISIKETQIKTAQRLQQNTDQMELDAAKLKLDTILNDKTKSYAEQLAAQEEYDAKVAEIDKRDKERKEAAVMGTLNVTKNGLQATADLVSAFAGKSKEAQKKAFEFQKGVNIANAVIDTYQSAVAAYKGSIGIPIVGPVLGPIAAATAIAAGIANIRKIEQTTFDSKDSPSSGGGGGGGGSFAPNLSAPVGNTSTNLASIGFGQEQTAEPVKVFVTETDISSSQKNVQKIEQKASIE